MKNKDSLEALREMVTSTLKYLPDNVIEKISKLSNVVLQDLERLEKLEQVIDILKRKLSFRYDRDIFVIHKDIFLKKHPQIRVMTNYEEDELIKEVLDNE